jgi:hypothetical protein
VKHNLTGTACVTAKIHKSAVQGRHFDHGDALTAEDIDQVAAVPTVAFTKSEQMNKALSIPRKEISMQIESAAAR